MPEILTVAYYSDFMTKEQFREQAETGIVQLQYAVPEQVYTQKMYLILAYSVGYYYRVFCSAWLNNTRVGNVGNFHDEPLVSKFAKYKVGYRFIRITPSSNGLHQIKCTTKFRTIYDKTERIFGDVKSVNLTFVKGQSQPLSAELTINLSSSAQIQPSLFLLRLCSLLNNLRETFL